jgi:hypothetical protein
MFLNKKCALLSGPPFLHPVPDLPPPGSRGVMGHSRGVLRLARGVVAMWAIPPL